MVFVLAFFAVMSIVAMCAFGIDKGRARRGAWRIPEATLLGLCFLGGAVGGLLGMYGFHHKTRKPKFVIGVPAALIVNVAALVLAYRLLGR